MRKLELILGETKLDIDLSALSNTNMDAIYVLLDRIERSVPEGTEFRARISNSTEWGGRAITEDCMDEISKEVDEYMYGHHGMHTKMEWGCGAHEHPFDVIAFVNIGSHGVLSRISSKYIIAATNGTNNTLYFMHGFDPKKIPDAVKEICK